VKDCRKRKQKELAQRAEKLNYLKNVENPLLEEQIAKQKEQIQLLINNINERVNKQQLSEDKCKLFFEIQSKVLKEA
jgi:transcription elongation GreA/GreB family factor